MKSGWESGDRINIWFDGYWCLPAQIVLHFNGSNWETEVIDQLLSTKLDPVVGEVTAIYEGHNDLSKWDRSSLQAIDSCLPLVATCEKALYFVDGAEVSISLDNWTFEDPIQIVVPGADASKSGEYKLQSVDLFTGDYVAENNGVVTMGNASWGQFTGGVANSDGIAFYFVEAQAAQDGYTFILMYNGNKYSYTTAAGKSFSYSDTKRCAVKLPVFSIDESGNPTTGCK